jgi:hypothetical protein
LLSPVQLEPQSAEVRKFAERRDVSKALEYGSHRPKVAAATAGAGAGAAGAASIVPGGRTRHCHCRCFWSAHVRRLCSRSGGESGLIGGVGKPPVERVHKVAVAVFLIFHHGFGGLGRLHGVAAHD